MSSLDLALVGNGTIGVLVNPLSEVVWGCFPRFDGDPSFCSLLRERTRDSDFGFFVVELGDVARAEQEYLVNTPVLVTRLYDRAGAGVEITDFAPRFHQYGRLFSPMMLVRQIRRIAGNPRIRVRLRPAQRYGRVPAETTCGSNHIRYAGADLVLRLTTDASITALMEENPFYLEDAVTLLLGRHGHVGVLVHHFPVGGAASVGDPGARTGAHDRLHGGHQAARGPPQRDDVASPDVDVRLAVGDDQHLVSG